jgi:DNA-binding response OmpR family regulator
VFGQSETSHLIGVRDVSVGEAALGSLRVLLVEDEFMVREMAADTLKDEGFEVIEAATGDEAARLLVDPDAIDVVFTDVRMPGKMDGIDVAVHARELHPGIAVLVVSGFAPQLWERLEGLDPPAAFLSKPYRTQDVVSNIRRLAA